MRLFILLLVVLAASSASAADLATETRKLYDGIALAEQALSSGNADVENSAITKEAFADKIAAEILPALTLAQATWTAAADAVSTDAENPDRSRYEDCSYAAGDLKNALASRERWLRGGAEGEVDTFGMYMDSFAIMKPDCETALGLPKG